MQHQDQDQDQILTLSDDEGPKEPKTVTLRSSYKEDADKKDDKKDDNKIQVEFKYAKISLYIKGNYEDKVFHEDPATFDPAAIITIDLNRINYKMLTEIVKFMKIRKGDAAIGVRWPLESRDMTKACEGEYAEDAKFIDTYYKNHNLKGLYKLVYAANYMSISALVHLSLAKIASLIKGVPLDQIWSILTQDNKLVLD
jgi:hypothetical protein